jgi:predicted amidohydrolase YtcJ
MSPFTIPIRVYAMLSARDEGLLQTWIEKGPDAGTESMLRTRSVKVFYDGALGSRGAKLLEDYSDRSGHRGLAGGAYGFDAERVGEMMRGGFQMAIHAIGDAGNRETLDFLERIFAESPDTRAQRHRVEHAQVVHPDDIGRFAELGLIASMEPPHAVEDRAWAEDRLGADRITGAYAWRSLRAAGTRLIFNSDLPGSDHDIFYGLHAAITRRGKDLQPAEGWYPDQRMSPEEALRAYSTWAAFASFTEQQTGIIDVERWADLTVMDVDPLNVGADDPGSLLDGRILATIVAGKVVWEDRR